MNIHAYIYAPEYKIDRIISYIMFKLDRMNLDPKLIFANTENYYILEAIFQTSKSTNIIKLDLDKYYILLDKILEIKESTISFDFEILRNHFELEKIGLSLLNGFAESVNTIPIQIYKFDVKRPITFRTSFILNDKNKKLYNEFIKCIDKDFNITNITIKGSE